MEGDTILCEKHEACVIPFHECLFSYIGLQLPFNDFEVGVLNHMGISPSQFDYVIRSYIKVFQ